MASSSFKPSSYRYSSSSSTTTTTTTDSAMENSSRAVVKARSADIAPTTKKNTTTFGTMVKKFMDKKPSNVKPRALPVPIENLLVAPTSGSKKGKGKGNFSDLHRRLFQKGEPRCKALTEVRSNTRTLAMVLRSERELLDQNKEYEDEIQELRLLVEEKDRQVEKLKDLCLKQREEIKALKDAILFPDVMNSQLHELLEKQGSELKQAKHIIPTLQKQVSSLTGQLQCLVDDLAEVKADQYVAKTCYDGYISSPETPKSNQEAQNSLEYSSGCPVTAHGSPDEMFLKDLNPCLTPCFLKTKSKEYHRMLGYGCSSKDRSFEASGELSPDNFSICRDGFLSKSSENCQQPSQGYSTSRKIYKSDESKWSLGKSKHQSLF